MVFIDDILVYSKTWNEHMELLREVFRRMRENNLQAKLSDRFEVERIIDRKTEGRRIMYCVKWKGYAMRDATWEPRTNLMQDCPSLVREFDEKWKREQQKKEEQLQRALKQTLDRQKL